MAITTLSSREFNQNRARAKRAASKGPVFITDRGRPSHVFLTIEQYNNMSGKGPSLLDMLAMPGAGEIDPDFEFPRVGDEFPVPVDFS